MSQLLLVMLGGGIGSGLRYLVGRWLTTPAVGTFPLGTFAVNIVGCLLIGLLSSLVSRSVLSVEMRMLLVTGFCGGFTTFSTFASESFSMMRTPDILMFLVYVTLSLWAGIGAVWIGTRMA